MPELTPSSRRLPLMLLSAALLHLGLFALLVQGVDDYPRSAEADTGRSGAVAVVHMPLAPATAPSPVEATPVSEPRTQAVVTTDSDADPAITPAEKDTATVIAEPPAAAERREPTSEPPAHVARLPDTRGDGASPAAMAELEVAMLPGLSPARATEIEDDPVWVRRYHEQLLAHLARFQRYPALAYRLGEEGTVQLTLAVARDGRLLDRGVAGGSGSDVLDNAAVALLDRAEPLPPLPEGIRKLPHRMRVPVVYRMDTR